MIYDHRIVIHPVDCARFEFHLARRGENIDIDGTVLGEPIPFSICTDRSQSGFTGEVRLWAGLTAMTGYTDYQFDDDNITATDRFGSLLLGAATYRYHGLSIGQPGGWHLRLIAGEYCGRGRLDVFSDGTRFGQIARLQAEIKRWQIEAGLPGSGNRRRIIIERFSADAETAGHVESWPFTDPLIDLLGLRRNFRAEAEAVIWHASGRNLFPLPHEVRLLTEIDLFRIYPELHWADWMPAYMVFGVTDMDHYYDEYDRLDIGRLNLTLSRQFGRFILDCRLSQLFPVKLKKSPADDHNAAAGEPDPGPADSAGSGRARDDGGRIVQFRLDYNF
jgi:hypothetical protein